MRVPAVLGLLAVGLSAQSIFGQMHISFEPVSPANRHVGQHDGLANALQESTTPNVMPDTHVFSRGSSETQDSGSLGFPRHRQLANVEVWIRVTGLDPMEYVLLQLKITKLDGGIAELQFHLDADNDGVARVLTAIDEDCLNDQQTGVCEGCTLEEELLICSDTSDCGDDFAVSIFGDPHMVGLRGQKIDWAGVDNAWYCLLSDGPDFHLNVRLSAPMPEEFPDRQLISAVSIVTDDGLHSLVIEVKDPYSTNTDGCPKDSPVPCLADGGLRILVDKEEPATLQSPSENVRLPGSVPVVLSTTNLPAECRPFGGDRIWAAQFDDITTHGRNLRLKAVAFDQWILQPDTLAAPTWCAKFLEEGGSAGLFSTRSEHATLRVESPVASVRINVGVNYQDLETASDGTMLVPELEFWQTDLGFDGLLLSGNVAGLMGDTSRVVLDDKGLPVTSGLEALHAPVESYRVAGPFARDFEKLHQ